MDELALPGGYQYRLTEWGRKQANRIHLFVNVSELPAAKRWVREYQHSSKSLLVPLKTYSSRASCPRTLHHVQYCCAIRRRKRASDQQQQQRCEFRLSVRLLNPDSREAVIAGQLCLVTISNQHAHGLLPGLVRLPQRTEQELEALARGGLTPAVAMRAWYHSNGLEAPTGGRAEPGQPSYAHFVRTCRRLGQRRREEPSLLASLRQAVASHPQLGPSVGDFVRAVRSNSSDPGRLAAMLASAVRSAGAAASSSSASASASASTESAASTDAAPSGRSADSATPVRCGCSGDAAARLRAFGSDVVEGHWLPMLLASPSEALPLFRHFYYVLYAAASAGQLRARVDAFEIVHERADSLGALLTGLFNPAEQHSELFQCLAEDDADTAAADQESLRFLASAFVSNVLTAHWPKLLTEAAGHPELCASVRQFALRAASIGSRRLLLSSLRHFSSATSAAAVAKETESASSGAGD